MENLCNSDEPSDILIPVEVMGASFGATIETHELNGDTPGSWVSIWNSGIRFGVH